MWLIDADTAQQGLTIVAEQQTKGKGQRGKNWNDTPGESLLMSIVLTPVYDIEHQFCFNMAISLALADILQEMYEHWDVRIKWPNDIIVNDKKAGGVLIENVIRGNDWIYSVVGIGINIMQSSFSYELPFATSLHMESKQDISKFDFMSRLRERIIKYTMQYVTPERLLNEYHNVLYKCGDNQRLAIGKNEFIGTVLGVTLDGMLQVQLQGGDIANYNHGAVEWVWG